MISILLDMGAKFTLVGWGMVHQFFKMARLVHKLLQVLYVGDSV